MANLQRATRVGVLLAAILVAACRGPAAESIAGTYHCVPPGDSGFDVVVLEEDGTLTITQKGVTGPSSKWSSVGDSVIFNPGTPEEETATIEGDGFAFPDGFVCTPAG